MSKKKIDFNWKYPAIFHPVINFNGRYIALTGGRGSGKSWFVAHLLLEMCMYRKIDVLCAREHQESIEKSNHKILKDIINLYHLPYKVTDKKIVSLTTGSRFDFIGLSDITAENVKSSEDYGIAWLEEAQKISELSWKYLRPTIRKPGSKIFITMNPLVPHEKSPIMSELTTYLKEKTLHIHANYYDNPFLSKEQRDEAELTRIHKPEEYKDVWLGEPDSSLGNLIVKGFSKDNIRPLFYQPGLDLHISCDFNYDPMCWVMFHKDQNKMYVFDELIEERTSTQECARKLIERYPDHKGRIILNGDASGMQKNCAHSNPDMTNFFIIQRELENYYHRQVDIDIRRANPHKIKRFECFNNLVKRYDGEICFYIDPKCKWTLFNIENAKYKEGTREVDEPTVSAIQKDPKLKFMIHPLDAVTYPAEYYWEVV
jgi:phage terminase large subunit